MPQPPQLVRLDVVSVSQPLLLLPSQSPNPDAHTAAQTPLPQEVVPWALVQALPHMPQLVALVPLLVSQPLAYWPSQSLNGAVHDPTAHIVPLHTGVPLRTAQTL